MKLLTNLFLITALVASAADPKPLAERLAEEVAKAPATVRGAVGIEVLDLETGKSVFAYNEQQLFLPASNMKLFTAAAVLARLGPDFRYETRLVQEPSGALALIGSGDPTISARVYPYSADAKSLPSLHAIEALADQAMAAGLKRVDGDIIGDDRRYAWSPYPESWTADDVEHDYGAPVSALSLADNTVRIRVRAGATAGSPATIELDPPFEYFLIDNRVKTTTSGSASVQINRIPGTRQVRLTGTITSRAGAIDKLISVDDPALFAAHALYDALLRRGVSVRGRPVARHGSGEAVQVEGRTLATRQSPPLDEILRQMLKVSQNLHAEMLLREAGYAASGQGTVAGGLKEIEALLDRLEISATEWRSEDGSGLARNDEVTPRAITRLLQAMAAGDQGPLWQSLLPVGGEDGTLSDRLCCTSDASLIRAKTGTLARAIALSGYADSASNGRLAFSILVNNFAASSSVVRTWVDSLAGLLVE